MIKFPHIIVFGGYFDPPHEGHLRLVLATKNKYPKAQIYVVPSFAPPKVLGDPKEAKASFEEREMMCHLLFDSLANVEVSNIEKNLPVPNYSLNTLEYFQSEFKPERLSFLMGDDQFDSFTKWHEYKKILQIADLLVATRQRSKDFDLSQNSNFAEKVEFIENDVSAAQSRLIRENSKKHSDWLDPKVLSYANRHLIYTKKGETK